MGFLRNWECEFGPCCRTRENSSMMLSIVSMVKARIVSLNHIDCYHLHVCGSSICERVRSPDFLPKFEILPHMPDHLDYVHQ